MDCGTGKLLINIPFSVSCIYVLFCCAPCFFFVVEKVTPSTTFPAVDVENVSESDRRPFNLSYERERQCEESGAKRPGEIIFSMH